MGIRRSKKYHKDRILQLRANYSSNTRKKKTSTLNKIAKEEKEETIPNEPQESINQTHTIKNEPNGDVRRLEPQQLFEKQLPTDFIEEQKDKRDSLNSCNTNGFCHSCSHAIQEIDPLLKPDDAISKQTVCNGHRVVEKHPIYDLTLLNDTGRTLMINGFRSNFATPRLSRVQKRRHQKHLKTLNKKNFTQT